MLEEVGGFLGHLAGEENEETSGEGVESAGVTDFDFMLELITEFGADFGDDAETTDASGLVDKDNFIFHTYIISLVYRLMA